MTMICNWREGLNENQPEFQVQIENNHLVNVGEESVVEGGHVEQVEVETNRVNHGRIFHILCVKIYGRYLQTF